MKNTKANATRRWVIKSPGTDGQEEIVDSHRAVRSDLRNRKYKPPLAVVSPRQPKGRQITKDGHGHGRDEMASNPRSHWTQDTSGSTRETQYPRFEGSQPFSHSAINCAS